MPNFGPDKELASSQKELAIAEQKIGHKLSVSGPKDSDIETGYFVPNFGVDKDILGTQ